MLTKYKCLGLLSIAALCLPLACKTQMDKQPLLLDPEVRTGKLANGFTYYIRKNKTPEKRVTMYLAIKAGSILETDQQRGVAHFVEHMSFNGTKHFPKKELSNYLEKAGVRFGADLNANTGLDETVYQLPLPSDQPELLANGLQIMRDWAQDADMNAEDVERERHVILEEKRYHQGLSQRYQEQAIPFYTNKSRFGSRLPIGTEEVLLKVTPEEIRSFYKDWYRPNLEAILVVGDIDVDQMERDIKTKFSDLKNPEKEKVRTVYHSTLSGKNQYLQYIDPELGGVSLEILMKEPADTVITNVDYRKSLLKNLFGQMVSARFRGLPLAGFTALTGGLSAFSVNVTTKPAETEQGLKSIWLELRRMQEQGFTQAELERVKKVQQQKMADALKEKDKTASETLIRPYLQHFLTGSAAPGIAEEYKLNTELLSDIKLDEINALMDSYLKSKNRDIIAKSSAHNKTFLPDEATIQGWIESVYTQPLPPFVDDVQDLPMLKNEPVPGKITNVEDVKVLGLQKITLSNGLTVLLKKTNFQNDQIVFKGLAEGGASLSSDADYESAINAANLISAAGAGNYNAQQLGKLLGGKKVQVSPFILDNYQGFNGNTTPEDLPVTLELLHAYFTEPRKDEDSFVTLVERSKEQLTTSGNNRFTVFMDTANLVLGNNHVRKRAQSMDRLNAIKLDRAFQIYKDRFADASGFTFMFVGNLDLDKIKPLLEKYLGSLPGKGLRETIRDLGINIPPGRISKTIYKGDEQKSSVILAYSGPFDYNFEHTIQMNAIADVLKITLTERLRDQEGGTYVPNAQVTLSKYPKSRFSLVLTFDCAPQNVEKLIRSAQDELDKIRTKGPSAENLQKFKAARQVGLQTGSTNNVFWLDYLVSQVMNKEPLTQFFDYNTALNGLTVKSVQQAASTFIQDKNYVRLVLMPEKK
ncbi:pitrilysin family protein [Pedobacter sp. MC2016-24]|uniref:M16 family metallopeptidase n=1 Tax=Pedobacter sp. MC2016-24 TaxID=2780090 RepID=UPI001882B84F|nr:M16 family metallopeptidase [Pedobacter sp. MC2016-24]MBE9598556.1 insulinase family protein [Pedobacter sp. MC2016-24]